MYLEQIAKQYGMVDYLDHNTGKIYQLSKAFEAEDGSNELLVPVVPVFSDETLLGYARMANTKKGKA